ncbi:phage minor head protein [Parabacteroides merdae]|uniref:phage minor head protein n=1 Tax=Parabacteroides merdae TaxID=46503 RepID=UPI00189E22DB|nr:phage minor head protein [Parabacteroides merdae]
MEDEVPGIDENIFRAAVRRIFREQGFTAESMVHPKIRALVNATADICAGAIGPVLESGVIPDVMAQHLKEDVFVFSGFKTYRELREAADLLRDKNGLLKSFDRFYKDIAVINEKYNRHWLKAEYIFAQASVEMAAKWVDFEQDGDEYDLQYRTAGDDRVRYEHRVLHNVTLPPSDPFWDEFFPPNGWRCRCTVVQVRKGKFPRSDSNTAIQQGREATYQAGKNGVNKAAIFRYNPGKQQVVFPPHHPYYEVSERERRAIMTALYPEEKAYTVIPTIAGQLRIHSGHGKGEREENIRVASYFTNKYGYKIDLLDNPDGVKSADSFNRTLGYEEEYKVNQKEHPTKSSIDNLLRKAKEQADHIVLWIDSDISLEDLSAALRSRVKRSENIMSVTLVLGGKDISLARAEIVSEGFKIRLADLK